MSEDPEARGAGGGPKRAWGGASEGAEAPEVVLRHFFRSADVGQGYRGWRRGRAVS